MFSASPLTGIIPSHRVRRLLAEFLGVAGLMVILSGVAAILARWAGAHVPPIKWWQSLPSRLAPIWWRRRQADVQYQFPVAASLADDEASIAKVAHTADRIIPGHFPN